jgi:hypothetical protein
MINIALKNWFHYAWDLMIKSNQVKTRGVVTFRF